LFWVPPEFKLKPLNKLLLLLDGVY
jgi:hypothetical protein